MLHQLPRQIITALSLPKDFEISELIGNENDNYLVKSRNKSFVIKKIKSGQTAPNIELEGTYREYLIEAGLPVAPFLKLNDDTYVLSIGNNSYVISPYIEGSIAHRSFAMVSEAGSLLAEVHNLDSSKVRHRVSWYRKEYIPESINFIGDEYAAAKRAFAEMYANTTDFWNGQLPKGIIHGDIQDENFIVNDSNKIISIVDWEESGVEPVILDVAHSAQQLSYFNGEKFDEPLFNEFIESYQRVRLLHDIEKKLFGEAFRYTLLVLSVWAHVKASRNQIDKTLFSRVGNYYRKNFVIPEGL